MLRTRHRKSLGGALEKTVLGRRGSLRGTDRRRTIGGRRRWNRRFQPSPFDTLRLRGCLRRIPKGLNLCWRVECDVRTGFSFSPTGRFAPAADRTKKSHQAPRLSWKPGQGTAPDPVGFLPILPLGQIVPRSGAGGPSARRRALPDRLPASCNSVAGVSDASLSGARRFVET